MLQSGMPRKKPMGRPRKLGRCNRRALKERYMRALQHENPDMLTVKDLNNWLRFLKAKFAKKPHKKTKEAIELCAQRTAKALHHPMTRKANFLAKRVEATASSNEERIENIIKRLNDGERIPGFTLVRTLKAANNDKVWEVVKGVDSDLLDDEMSLCIYIDG